MCAAAAAATADVMASAARGLSLRRPHRPLPSRAFTAADVVVVVVVSAQC